MEPGEDVVVGDPLPQAADRRLDQMREAVAEYTLEYPAKCPCCGSDIDSVKVVRLLRTRVNFTSTLPRRGRVLVCPACQKILSAELSGFA